MKTFVVYSQAVNFLLSHKSAYVSIAEVSGKYVVIPKSTK